MTKKEITTLIGVITKLKEIADEEYDGLIYDNILAIFNKLTVQERRVLLKGLINIVFVVKDKILINADDLIEVKNAILSAKTTILSTQTSVEAVYENSELIKNNVSNEINKMKKSLLTMIAIFLIMIIIILISIMFHVSLGLIESLFTDIFTFIHSF